MGKKKFTKTRSMLGSGVVSQQFSIPEMVDLANFSSEFFRHAGEHLRILDNDPPDLHFLPVGVMHLARTQEEADADRGVHVALLNKEELKAKFPFMRFDDVVMGTYLKGDFEGVTSYNQGREVPLHGAVPVEEIRPQMSGASPRPINCYKIFNAAGPWAGEIAKKAGVGFKGEMMRIPLPIVCTRRTNFVVHAPEVPPLSMPILMDSSGIFCRPDAVGHNYICGREPTKSDAAKTLKEEDQQIKSSDEPPIDYNEFYEQVWPLLVERVPSFRTAKVINAWHSYEDVNMFDEAPIIGEHLVHENFIQVCGLGGYGPQMSIAIGKALSERFYDRAYVTKQMIRRRKIQVTSSDYSHGINTIVNVNSNISVLQLPESFDRNVPESVVHEKQISNNRIHLPPLLSSSTTSQQQQNTYSSYCNLSESYYGSPQKLDKSDSTLSEKRSRERPKEKLCDTKKFTMAGKKKWSTKRKNDEEEKASILSKTDESADDLSTSSSLTPKKGINIDEEKEEKPPTSGPRVRINEQGEMVVDEDSLIVMQNPENVQLETVINNDVGPKKLTSMSFRKRSRGSIWNVLETDLFYEVLAATGTDFGLMHEFIPNRSRLELKQKFNREHRINPRRMDETLRHPVLLDGRLRQRVERFHAELAK
uniref:FAD dependent oxidoreductase domain-containing protein n=1 Tax=Meloidogyne javanica TaxID=6303 RepID=A0A915LLA8_MELJA